MNLNFVLVYIVATVGTGDVRTVLANSRGCLRSTVPNIMNRDATRKERWPSLPSKR